jgi:tubulin polyglutamylase TTLL5
LILDGQVIRSRLSLAAVVPALASCLATHAARHDDIAIDAGLVAGPDGEVFLVSHSEPSLRDALTLALSTQWRVDYGRGALLTSTNGSSVTGLGLPLHNPDGKSVFTPAKTGIAGFAGRVNALLVPSAEPLGDDSGVQTLTVNESLRHLISSCCGEDGRPLDTEGFAKLAGWLEGRERYLVDMNNLEAAAAALSGRCFEKAPQKASGGR